MTVKSFNYSAINTAYRCEQLYQYLYVDKLTPPGPEGLDLHFGTAMHSAIQAILEGDSGEDAFRVYWGSLKETQQGRYTSDELKDQALNVFIPRFERLHAKKFVVTQMEERLYGTLGDVRVEGTPDFLGTFEGIPSIVDFKTSGYRYPKERIVTSEQMYLYAHLAQQRLGFKPNQLVYLVFVKGKEPSIQTLKCDLSIEKLSNMLGNIHQMCHKLSQLNVAIKNRNSCLQGENKCVFWNKCYSE